MVCTLCVKNRSPRTRRSMAVAKLWLVVISVRNTDGWTFATLILRGLDCSPVHDRIRSASSIESGHRPSVQNLFGDIIVLIPAWLYALVLGSYPTLVARTAPVPSGYYAWGK